MARVPSHEFQFATDHNAFFTLGLSSRQLTKIESFSDAYHQQNHLSQVRNPVVAKPIINYRRHDVSLNTEKPTENLSNN